MKGFHVHMCPQTHQQNQISECTKAPQLWEPEQYTLDTRFLSEFWLWGFQGPMVSTDKCDQQVQPEAPRKQRKERTVYSQEQKLLLQEHFGQCMDPSLEEHVELALMIGMTEYEIKIWFKHQRAKYKQKNLWKIHKVLPE